MLVIVRGAGDLATGVIHRLYRSGFKILALEIEKPSAIRRSVVFSECIYNLEQVVEGVKAKKVNDLREIEECWKKNEIPVAVDPVGKYIEILKPQIVIDAIIAKKNYGTNMDMAPITIALGPGFVAGRDVNIVVETMRGHNLGRLIYDRGALPNTGEPGDIAGITKERVIYSEKTGFFKAVKKIGDYVKRKEILGYIDETPVFATIDGLLRGIISDNYEVKPKFKIADIDPRLNQYDNCFTISDKARSLGGAVLEGILSELHRKGEEDGFKYFGESF
ncbi:selenium-dependent molybdenum cofactor biosynthesis protein YqeB [Cetobacterium sp. ZOR0034]|uniref:selenium-dependent molybdenum cofactor biosynthesis protein YqeB n=1 Tax=Cetobacterium sp. ZOR0034 TaxID=1339239 RepID=UPI00064837AA|nr:selenium-dependent molybdenum cofactor biosynthesis protein YqeB [Cetobacterium sp. ZOR0034]